MDPLACPGEALLRLEAVEREQVIEFGELVRERRRQRGLPLPVAEKILPFREPPGDDDSTSPVGEGDVTMPSRAEAAQARATDAWSRLDAAALAGHPLRELDGLEEIYHAEMEAYRAASYGPSGRGDAPRDGVS